MSDPTPTPPPSYNQLPDVPWYNAPPPPPSPGYTPPPFPPAPEPKKSRKNLFIGLAIAGALVFGVAVGSAGNANDEVSQDSVELEPTSDIEPAVTTPETEPEFEVDDDLLFAVGFVAEYTDAMEDGIAAMGAASSALQDMDVFEGANQSALASQIFSAIANGARGLPEADSDLGHTIISAMDACSGAFGGASIAISDFNIPGMEQAVTEIGTCGTEMGLATSALEAATGQGCHSVPPFPPEPRREPTAQRGGLLAVGAHTATTVVLRSWEYLREPRSGRGTRRAHCARSGARVTAW